MLGWILQIKGSLCNGSALLNFQFLNNLECYKRAVWILAVYKGSLEIIRPECRVHNY